jgi:hypothetical protein
MTVMDTPYRHLMDSEEERGWLLASAVASNPLVPKETKP